MTAAPQWSSYDGAVPHPVGLADAALRFRQLRAARGPAPDLGAVRSVVVVASSSRGGCTLLGELLRRCPDLLHLRAETNPHFVIAGLDGTARSDVLAEELALDIGRPAEVSSGASVERLALDLAWRLTAQWPDEAVDPADVLHWTRAALQEGGPPDDPAFHLAFLAGVRNAHPVVHPGRYDLPADAVESRFAKLEPPEGPPGDQLIEMPPFVTIGGWAAPASTTELARKPLVLATPRNSYRLDFLGSLFPNAELRVLHLTRNPAASVNGLLDGWEHHGFFTVAVDRELRIGGYSDRYPWGSRWWKYDVPLAWEQLVDTSLSEVCAEQWRSAHVATLDHVDRHGTDRHHLRYEDLIGPADGRRGAVADLAAWLGVEPTALLQTAEEGLPPVMATAPPAPRRWVARAPELAPVLEDCRVRELADRLGYGTDPSRWV